VKASPVPGSVGNSKWAGSTVEKALEDDCATVKVRLNWRTHVAAAAYSLVARLVRSKAEEFDTQDSPLTWAIVRSAVSPKPNHRNCHFDLGSAGWSESH